MRASQNGYNPPETRLTKGCRDHIGVLHPDRLLAIFMSLLWMTAKATVRHHSRRLAIRWYDCDRRIGELQSGNPHELICRYTFWVSNRHRAEQEAHDALDERGLRVYCGGGTEWFTVPGGLDNIDDFAEIVRAAIVEYMQEEEDRDLAESSINLAPNQAAAKMAKNYGHNNTKWRQALKGNMLHVKYNCKWHSKVTSVRTIAKIVLRSFIHWQEALNESTLKKSRGLLLFYFLCVCFVCIVQKRQSVQWQQFNNHASSSMATTVKGAAPQQSSSFCLILPITRP